MKSTHRIAFVALAVAFAGCASTPPADVAAQAAQVKVYQTGEVISGSYDVVQHLWVDDWRTAYRYPTYATREEAVASLQAAAGRLGADGVLDVVCLDHARARLFQKAEPAIACYGAAIRIKAEPGSERTGS